MESPPRGPAPPPARRRFGRSRQPRRFYGECRVFRLDTATARDTGRGEGYSSSLPCGVNLPPLYQEAISSRVSSSSISGMDCENWGGWGRCGIASFHRLDQGLTKERRNHSWLPPPVISRSYLPSLTYPWVCYVIAKTHNEFLDIITYLMNSI